MTSTDEQLVELLRAALALEMRAETILRAQAPRLRRYFQLRERVERHLQGTLKGRSVLESCLNRLGTGPPAIEDLARHIAVCAESDGKNAKVQSAAIFSKSGRSPFIPDW